MRSLSQGKYTYKAREIKRKGDKQNPKQEMSWKKCCAKQTKFFIRSALCFSLVCVLVLFFFLLLSFYNCLFPFFALYCECD